MQKYHIQAENLYQRTGCDCLPSAVIAVVEDQWKPIAIMEKYCLAQHISSHSSHVCFNLMSHSIRAVDISGLGTGTRRRAYPHRQPLDHHHHHMRH
ncbi:Uncharacterized protein APZ42_018420 [Daphnia magna]|uniref:Uncharacterized protein n=1 Tax=Daphnia magna TaxID=35525 RepID=A0A164Z618_9CRUS|nr:Uncharacterized protein APZ42_018420 [Daphnia magna]